MVSTKTHLESAMVNKKADHAHQEYPIVCETCLGPNHFIRMLKFPEGGVCHVSGRPYNVFRWKAGNGSRYKKTVICQDLAKLKNVCQVCMLDLKYNLPVQVRDTLMRQNGDKILQENILPKSYVGREFALNEAQKNDKLQNMMSGKHSSDDILMNLSSIEPHYKRNQARICSFFVKGCCNRGLECPFRHTIPSHSQIHKQSYYDRYNGINDPVANKILSRVSNMSTLNPPHDKSITTIFIGNITDRITPQILKEKLYSYGEIQTIRMLYRRNCAFVTFCSRAGAEKATVSVSSQIVIDGQALAIRWCKTPSQISYKIM